MLKAYINKFVFSTKEGSYTILLKKENEIKVITDTKKQTNKEEISLLAIIDIINSIDNNTTVEINTNDKDFLNKINSLKKLSIIEINNTKLWANLIYLIEEKQINIKTKFIKNMIEEKENKIYYLRNLDMAIKMKEKEFSVSFCS